MSYVVWATAALALVAFFLLKRQKTGLFGPVLYYDLLRNGRRGQHVLWRTLYAFILLYVMIFLYLTCLVRYADPAFNLWQFLAGRTLSSRHISGFMSEFFGWFALLQMIAVSLLTPAYTAGAVAAERERGTLQELFGTDLRSHEIVLSMFVSRLANVLLVMLTGLPMVMLLEFMGGIDPRLVLALYGCIGLTMLGVGALGVYASVRYPKPRAAIMRTYTWVLLYFVISLASQFLLLPAIGIAGWPSTDRWNSPLTVAGVIDGFNAGNWFSELLRIREGMASASMDVLVREALGRYAVFHLILLVLALVAAIRSLRARVLMEEARDRGADGAVDRTGPLANLVLGFSPLLWKELLIQPANRGRWWKSLLFGIALAILVWPACHFMYWFGSLVATTKWVNSLGGLLNLWVRGLTALFGTVLLLQVGVRAAGLVCGERARGTLDALLATPLRAESILRSKWLTSLAPDRRVALILAVVWSIGIFTGAIDPLALLFVVPLWLVYASYPASLGIYFSTVCRGTARAVLLTMLGAGGTFAIISLLAIDLAAGGSEPAVLIPPVGLATLAFEPTSFEDLGRMQSDSTILLMRPTRTMIRCLVGASILWLALSAFVGWMARYRFRQLLGRNRRGEARPEDHSYAAGSRALSPTSVDVVKVTTGQFAKPRAKLGALSGSLSLLRSMRLPLPRLSVIWCCLPLMLLAAGYGYLAHQSKLRLEAAYRRALETDGPWIAADLTAHQPFNASADRAGALIVELTGQLSKRLAWQSLCDPRFYGVTTARWQWLNPVQMREVESIVRDYDTVLAKTRQLSDFRTASFRIDTPYFNYDMLTNLLWLDMLSLAKRGDTDGVLRSLKCELLIFEAADQAWPWSSMTLTNERILLRLHELLLEKKAKEETLRDFQCALESYDARTILLTKLRASRSAARQELLGIQTGKMSAPICLVPFQLQSIDSLVGPDQQRIYADMIDSHTDVAEILKQPESEHDRLLAARPNRFAAGPAWRFANIVRQIGPSRIEVARIRASILMLACERFRMSRHTWPPSLADLAPTFIQRIPTDPFDGRPLRYRVMSDRIVIYSIGPDLVDNGGAINGPKASDIGYDLLNLKTDSRPLQQPSPDSSW